MNFEGVLLGIITFLIIGLLHPVVIKSEYYIGKRIWPLFLVSGLICIGLSIITYSVFLSSILAVFGFSLLWSIHELFEQEKRVERGWYPANDKKNRIKNKK